MLKGLLINNFKRYNPLNIKVMKKVLCLFAIFYAQLTLGQVTINQSNGTISDNITTPTGIQPDEAFRFRAGNVRQLDAGSSFTFNNSRWFSLGRVNTGSQSVYGLRLQLPNKALTLGYQDIADANPRIQWIGTGSNLGDLEFRVADSFTSTNSSLVATMTSDGKTAFGKLRDTSNPFTKKLAKVEIENLASNDINNPVGLRIFSTTNQFGTGESVGFDITQTSGSSNTGGKISTSNGTICTGLKIVTQGTEESVGISSSTSSFNARKIGFYGRVIGAGPFVAAVYGQVIGGNSNSYAGFFEGNVFTTGSYLASDKKLKENIIVEKNALERLSQLKPITYNYKKINEIILSEEKQHGFISQDFAVVFPELTKEITKPIFDENGEMKSNYSFKAINYSGLISVLTSAVNELNVEVEVLKKELAELKNDEYMSEFNTTISSFENNEGFVLKQNIPNPFSDRTSIRYKLEGTSNNASLMIFDMSGKIVKEFKLSEKAGEITIGASQIGQGMFIYSLVENGQELISKKLIVK